MAESGRLMAGLTTKSLGKHPSLIPLLIAIGGGAVLAGGYLFRLAAFNPDVCWDRKNNPYPWQKYGPADESGGSSKYRFVTINVDYKNLAHPSERPKID